jgi:nitroreductase/SAM-dependent methyltransferase
MTESESVPVANLNPVNGDAFMALLEGRRSTRMFKEAPVPGELLERLVRAATLLPTACNRQLWHFVAVTDPAIKATVSKLSDAQQSYLYDAPVLMAVFYDTSLETRNPCNTAEIGTGIAVGTLLLAAEAHGLGAIYLGGIRKPAGIGKALGAPPFLRCFGLVCVGWRDDDPPAPNRRPVAEVLEYNVCTKTRPRFHADIRPHRWSLAQIADFRDKLLWYKGVHIDGKTLHVDPDPRACPLFQFMTGRLGMMLARYDKPRVLDVLSFNGDVVYQLLNAAAPLIDTLYAYDLTPGIGRYIRERFKRLAPPGYVECLSNTDTDRIAIPLPDGHVQVLSCYERLEHFEDPLPLLREMRRVLAPNGRALVLVSNRFYPHLYRYRRMRKKDYALGRNWNRGPERKFEPAQIERLLEQAGFRVTAAFGVQPVFLKAAALLAALYRRIGLHGRADRVSDWSSQRFAIRGRFRKTCSVLAYEIE